MKISFEIEQEVYKYGTYYNPASKHYSLFEDINVVCDRCNRSRLPVCIGYNEYDLCLKCVDAISDHGKFIFKKETKIPKPLFYPDINLNKETPYPIPR